MRHLFKMIVFLLELLRGERLARFRLAAIVVTGIASGVSIALLISVINALISGDGQRHERLWRGFALLLTVRLVLRLVSQYLMVRLTQKAFLNMRFWICQQVLYLPLRRLEELGSPRILAGLTTDVGQVSQALVALPNVIGNFTVLLGLLFYLGWLSPVQLIGTLTIATIGYLTFLPLSRKAFAKYARGREFYDQLFKHFRALTEGAKELKMHSDRRHSFITALKSVAHSHQNEARAGDLILGALSSWTELLFYIAVAIVVFVGPIYGAKNPSQLIGYTLTILMIRAPLENLINWIQPFSQAVVAINKIRDLTSSVSAEVDQTDGSPILDETTSFKDLELIGVTHQYRGESALESFLLGPIDLRLAAGELVFIIGGNGSGKTTLAKILAGLYAPEGGEVRLDGTAISDQNRDNYRQNITAVFSDFFLFETLFGLQTEGESADAEAYLRLLALADKVKINNGSFSTVQLSQGQRKRLALFIAYLENRDIYILDEWAADQDTQFKKVFYHSLLPSLRARGKTVVVISHDDPYYGVTDRIIKLNAGKVVFDGNPNAYMNLAEVSRPAGEVPSEAAGYS